MGRAGFPCRVARPLRAAPVIAPLVWVEQLAEQAPPGAGRLVAAAALRPVVLADSPCQVVRAWFSAAETAPPVVAERFSVQRPSQQRVAQASLTLRAVLIFRAVPAVARWVRVARLAVAHRLRRRRARGIGNHGRCAGLAVIGSSACFRRCNGSCRRRQPLSRWRHFRLRDHLDDRRCRCRLQLLARVVVERLTRLSLPVAAVAPQSRPAVPVGPCARRRAAPTPVQAACRPARHCLARSSRSGPGTEQPLPAP